ncbi:hypothetical protein ACFWMJ_12310 [Streptomyces hawaiiensis]|uniref:hypothetical protein n=1 Tax=Streptomyces hawaiiensis TaxID=67305 RepID=UPI0036550F11
MFQPYQKESHYRTPVGQGLCTRSVRAGAATRSLTTPYVSTYAYADNLPTLLTDPSGLTPVPGDNGKVDSLGEGLKIFGNGFLEDLRAPFEFLGDAQDAVTGQNGGVGAFFDTYLPVRPAYRLYRAEYLLRQQGCDALADLYSDAADELAQQLAVTGVGGLTGGGDRRTRPRSRSSTREGSPPEKPKASTPSVTAKKGATVRTTN